MSLCTRDHTSASESRSSSVSAGPLGAAAEAPLVLRLEPCNKHIRREEQLVELDIHDLQCVCEDTVHLTQ